MRAQGIWLVSADELCFGRLAASLLRTIGASVLQQKVGIQLASLRQPLKKALLTAARLGARGVELDAQNQVFLQDFTQSSLRHLRKMLDDLNLQVCAVSFHGGGYHASEGLDARIAATMRAQRLAYQLGSPLVVSQVGTVPAQPSGPAWDLLVDSLSELGRYGVHVGARLAAETGSEPAADLKRLIEAVSEQAVAVDLNPAKLIANGFSPREAAEKLGAAVAHVHASDGLRDPRRGGAVEVTVGQGVADFPELLGMLENFLYRGFVTVEARVSNDPQRDIQAAIEYLKSL